MGSTSSTSASLPTKTPTATDTAMVKPPTPEPTATPNVEHLDISTDINHPTVLKSMKQIDDATLAANERLSAPPMPDNVAGGTWRTKPSIGNQYLFFYGWSDLVSVSITPADELGYPDTKIYILGFRTPRPDGKTYDVIHDAENRKFAQLAIDRLSKGGMVGVAINPIFLSQNEKDGTIRESGSWITSIVNSSDSFDPQHINEDKLYLATVQ